MSKYKFETLQLHVGQEQADPATDARAVPIYQTTSYVFRNSRHAADRFGLSDAGNIYGRLTNSTQDVLEKRLAALEGGSAALALASGAAAITYTIEALAANGGHIVSQKTIYGGSFNLLSHTLPQYGIETTFVDAHDLQEVEGAIKDNTRAIYLETLGNPNSDIPDIDAIAEIAHKHGLPLVIDNTFGTPYLIRPIEHGADIVVHSATKFIGGHGTTLGGIIVESGKFDWKASGKYPNIAEPNPSYHGISFYDAVGPAAFVTCIRAILLRDTGACISPFNAFLLLQGVRLPAGGWAGEVKANITFSEKESGPFIELFFMHGFFSPLKIQMIPVKNLASAKYIKPIRFTNNAILISQENHHQHLEYFFPDFFLCTLSTPLRYHCVNSFTSYFFPLNISLSIVSSY